MEETNKERRGHDFLPERDELAKWENLYTTEEVKTGDKVLFAHYFIGGSDWYIAERQTADNEDTNLCFGWACLNGDLDNAEWGYVSLAELESINIRGFVVERDLQWEAKSARQVLPERAWKWQDEQEE